VTPIQKKVHSVISRMGGRARARKLSRALRVQIARMGAEAMWRKKRARARGRRKTRR